MSDFQDGVLCDLGEGCWDSPCDKTKCIWNVNKKEAKNCFKLYQYLVRDSQHTLYEIANIMKISHTTVKQIENEASLKLKDTPLADQID